MYDIRQRVVAPTDKSRIAIVCGLPGSGNRMLRDLCHHLGVAAVVWHGDGKMPPIPAEAVQVFGIMPVRHPRYRALSSKSRPHLFTGPYQAEALRWLASVPRLIVSYEALVSDPAGLTQELASFLGVNFSGVPFPIYDANACRDAGIEDPDQALVARHSEGEDNG